MTQPKDQMSVRRSTTLPRACSGERYAAVPRITPAIVPGLMKVGECGSVGEESVLEAVGESMSAGDFASPDSSVATLPFARPKSRIFTWSCDVIITFAGFKSRCTTPASCAASMPEAIWMRMSSASGSGSGARASRSARVSPSISSRAR